MPNTLIPIQTYTLSASASSVTFSNIPQNYTDLKVVGSIRGSATGNFVLGYQFNAVATGYTKRDVETTSGTTVSSGTDTVFGSYGRLTGGYIDGASQTASTFYSFDWYIPNYLSSNQKSSSYDGVMENNATANSMELGAAISTGTAAITSITMALSSGNFVEYSTFSLYGISNGVKATGGTLTVAGGYAYHTFTSTGSFLPSQQIKGAEILMVAGGGGGATSVGGGGGGGGVVYGTNQMFNSGSPYTCIVGAGGTSVGSNSGGTDGSASLFGTVATAVGGGGGGSYGGSRAGNPGGSGGGGCGWASSASNSLGGASTQTLLGKNFVGFGNAGGNGGGPYGAGGSGGGGGAGGAGPTYSSGTVGMAGGPGTAQFTTWGAITGTGVLQGGIYYYAAGGPGVYGNGGSQASAANGAPAFGNTAGTANSGVGGVGDYGQTGGSGLIIVRYPLA
jgi:hypothetical protein